MFLFSSRAPLLGIEISTNALRGVELSSRGKRHHVTKRVSVELPAGLVTETFNRENVADSALFLEHLFRLGDMMGVKGRRVGLALPDASARVHVLSFETIPSKEQEFRDIIAWRLKREHLLPFEPHEAHVEFQLMGQKGKESGTPVLVSVMRRDVLAQYVSLFEEASFDPVVADLSAFHCANYHLGEMQKAAPSGTPGALLLVRGRRFSLLIFGGDALAFFRSREIGTGANQPGFGDALAKDIEASLTYYSQEHPGYAVGGFFVAGLGKDRDALRRLRPLIGQDPTFLEPDRGIQRDGALQEDIAGEYTAATGAAMGR